MTISLWQSHQTVPGDVKTSHKPIIYQLVVRYFSNTNLSNQKNGTISQNGCGKFSDINVAAIHELKALGFSHIWLTGIIRQATLTAYPEIALPADDADIVKGRAGSMYAIRDYYDVCPDYASQPELRMSEFESLVSRIHDAGMKVLIDFVPNHVARSYESIVRPEKGLGLHDDQSKFFQANNNFFYLVDPPHQPLQLSHPEHWVPPGVTFDGKFEAEDGSLHHTPKATGNNVISRSPPVDSWYEVVKLNYGFNFVTRETAYEPTPRTWLDMDEIINFWQAKSVDGFRCDFAHYVPAEAWTYLIKNARAQSRDPQCYFMAEAYPWAQSGDPITTKNQLSEAGFDAVYDGESYQQLKKIYQMQASLDDYDRVMTSRTDYERAHLINYLENHDEVRVAAPIGKLGFGSLKANYQLAPLQFLYGPGAVMILNGQEIGEPGGGDKGFSGDDGRTTIFDYWCMPEFAKWVNEHQYAGAKLSQEQSMLRKFFSDLLNLCQDPAITGSSYWGLRYFNRQSNFSDCPEDLYSFARYESFSSRVLVVVANFNGSDIVTGSIRLPEELAASAHLNQDLHVRCVLDEKGSCDTKISESARNDLSDKGFEVVLAPQSCQVFIIE